MSAPTSPPNWIELSTAGLSVAIDPLGAQLMSFKTVAGQEFLWQGDSVFWPDRAPILFPVIGPVEDGQIHHHGQSYPMPPHGFAKLRQFTVEERSGSHAVFALYADEESRRHYPFAFVLRVTFDLTQERLLVTLAIENRGDDVMPADAGFHPGFNWPLTPGHDRSDYVVTFEQPEPDPIRRGVDDPIFLTDEAHPTPVEGDTLRPRDELFEDNAMVFDRVRSRAVTVGPANMDGLSLRVAFPDSPYLAIWTRPAAPFLAIEPWHGLPSPVGFSGPLSEKPGIAHIAPGEPRRWRLELTPLSAQGEGQ